MDEWDRVGRAIAERIEELGLTKAEVIRRSGVSGTSLDAYIAGQPIKRKDKLAGLCAALGWTPDSVELVRRGEQPVATVATSFDRVLARLDAQDAVLAEILAELRARPK